MAQLHFISRTTIKKISQVYCKKIRHSNSQMQTNFLNFLNTQHTNIKCTFEKQDNKQISFLDVPVTNDGDQFSTSVFD